PGPEMMTLLFTSSSPLARGIVPVTANVIVSPSFAMASALRSEPGPLSLVLVTMMVVGVAVAVTVGVAVAVGVGVRGGPDCAQYLPPVFVSAVFPNPPQTIISPPVQTAMWRSRGDGALMVLVSVQVSMLELYLSPVLKNVRPSPVPPHTIISLPVQTAVWNS